MDWIWGHPAGKDMFPAFEEVPGCGECEAGTPDEQ